MDGAETLLLAGALGLGGFAVWKLTGGGVPTAPDAGAAPPKPGALQTLEAAAPYGSLAAALGHTAQAAPTALKVLLPAVALTGEVQSFIDHPTATLKGAGTAAKNFGAALIPGHSSCSGDCPGATSVEQAREMIAKVPTINGLRDCIRSVCSQKFGVQL